MTLSLAVSCAQPTEQPSVRSAPANSNPPPPPPPPPTEDERPPVVVSDGSIDVHLEPQFFDPRNVGRGKWTNMTADRKWRHEAAGTPFDLSGFTAFLVHGDGSADCKNQDHPFDFNKMEVFATGGKKVTVLKEMVAGKNTFTVEFNADTLEDTPLWLVFETGNPKLTSVKFDGSTTCSFVAGRKHRSITVFQRH